MKRTLSVLIAASFALAGAATAMTKEEHAAQDKRIDADYKAAIERCDGMSGNAKDVCKLEAKGAQKVGKAEIDAQYKPSPKASAKLAEVKAEAAYDVAKERCDDLAGNAKDACVKEAKAVLANAKAHPAAVASGG